MPFKVRISKALDYYSSGSGDTFNNYSVGSLNPPQLFNPDAAAVTANTDDYTLLTSNSVGLVTLNGQVLDDSEYTLAGSTLTVTPDVGFSSTSDEVLVFQHYYDNVSSGLTLNYVSKTSTYTVQLSDYVIDCNGTFTVTLPTAVGIGGQSFVIKNSGTGTITLDANGSETIDGNLTVNLSTQYESITVVSNGNNWAIV